MPDPPPTFQLVTPSPAPWRGNLHNLAKLQRSLIRATGICFLFVFFGLFTAFFASMNGLRLGSGVLAFECICMGSFYLPAIPAFRLSIALYGRQRGISAGLPCLIPLFGLIGIAIINEGTIRAFKSHGIRVGFLGVTRSRLPLIIGDAVNVEPIPEPAPKPDSIPASPTVLNYLTPANDGQHNLRAVAFRQRMLMYCLLAYVGAIAGLAALLSLRWLEAGPMLIGLSVIPMSVVAALFVYLLAAEVCPGSEALGLGLLAFVPMLGLLALLHVNSKATNILEAGGISVGLLGADSDQIPLQ